MDNKLSLPHFDVVFNKKYFFALNNKPYKKSRIQTRDFLFIV